MNKKDIQSFIKRVMFHRETPEELKEECLKIFLNLERDEKELSFDEQNMNKECSSDVHGFEINDLVIVNKESCLKFDRIGKVVEIDEHIIVVIFCDDKEYCFSPDMLTLIKKKSANSKDITNSEQSNDEQNMFKIGDKVRGVVNSQITGSIVEVNDPWVVVEINGDLIAFLKVLLNKC